jgi:putative transposase
LPLHIVQRGHNREKCFFAEVDYMLYLRWLAEALARNSCQLHAYVLMTNHIHLLVTPHSAEGVPRAIMSLGRRYVPHVNRTYNRTGALWESRYKSSLVVSDAYFLACHRYIELNPVRAGIVKDPSRYRWSSYGANALGHESQMLTPHSLYQNLGTDVAGRREAYRRLFAKGIEQSELEEIRWSLQSGEPVGGQIIPDKLARRARLLTSLTPNEPDPQRA